MIASLWMYNNAIAQSPNIMFRHITRSSGLPVDVVTCLAQDSSGFIWIGTIDGLFRFDGFTYKAYYSSPGQDGSLYTNYIYRLFVDSKGRLWISTYEKGLSVMEPGADSIKKLDKAIINGPGINPNVSDIKEDSKQNLWFTTLKGLYKMSPDGKTWSQYKPKTKTEREGEIWHLAFDREGKLLIGGLSRLWRFDPAAERFLDSDSNFKKAFDKRSYFRSIINHEGKIWFSTWADDLGFYNVSSRKIHMLYSKQKGDQPDLSKMALLFYPDSKGGLWMCTNNGLHFISPGSNSITRSYYHEAGNLYSVISNNISSVLEDREGNLWVGTNEGISIAEPYEPKIINYSNNGPQHTTFRDKEVNDIIELDDHSMLIGTQNADGIYKTNKDFVIENHFSFGDPAYDWIWKHYKDEKAKKIYIATQEGMLIYDQKRKTLSKSTDSLFHGRGTVSSMVRLSDDEVWFSYFFNTFFRYNLRTGQHKKYQLTSLGEPSQVILLRVDANNKLWILGHISGLMQFDDEKEKIIERLAPDSSLNSLRQSGVWVLLDLGDYFLIGYDTHGISLFNKQTKKYEHFGHSDGLINNRITDAFVGPDKTVWISTANGISNFNPLTKKFTNYDQRQGMMNSQTKCISSLSDGRIIAGTNKGIIVFNPANIVQTKAPPAPVITDIYVLDKKRPLNVSHNGGLFLSHKENYFSFDFISLVYDNNNLVEYAYKLEGLQKDWVISGNRRFVSYANVPAGNYTFKIKCRLPGGPWIENERSLAVEIQAAFYTRWWFFLFVGLTITALIYVFFWYRLQRILQLERMRSSISGDLHDEVGSSLTSISIFSEMARKTTSPLSKEDQYLQHIGDRSRESIDKMSDIVWSINPTNDTLEQMLVRMKAYTTEIAEAKDIIINWDENVDHLQTKLSMEHRKNIYLFYKEVVNNVIKHSDAKNIYIIIHSVKKGLTLSIKDDGKGFDTTSVSAGNGLKNINRRSTFLKGIIDIKSDSNNGTSIQLFIPY